MRQAIRWAGCAALLVAAAAHGGQPQKPEPIRGWTILSDSVPDALAVIGAARPYDVTARTFSYTHIR